MSSQFLRSSAVVELDFKLLARIYKNAVPLEPPSTLRAVIVTPVIKSIYFSLDFSIKVKFQQLNKITVLYQKLLMFFVYAISMWSSHHDFSAWCIGKMTWNLSVFVIVLLFSCYHYLGCCTLFSLCPGGSCSSQIDGLFLNRPIPISQYALSNCW